MAGTKNTAHVVQLKPVEVPKCMQDGEKFIKWDEDSGVGTPVTLRVDKNGFYLHWVDQNKEMDMLDIAYIRDTRTGKHAKIPKDPKLRQIVTMGSQDTLEEKTVTVCCGSDFVNISFINFCCTKKEIAQLWTDELLKIAYNLLQLNSSAIRFLNKAHTKLTLMIDKAGKIPIKNVIKVFAQNKDDKKRVEKALDISGLPSGKNDALSLQKFQFEDFFNFYKSLTHRVEVEKIFEELCGGTTKRRLMSAAQFVEFLNKTQRDPRLNEILYPYANTSRAKDLISQYEPNKYNAQRGQFSFDGFLRYLMSEDNPIVAPSKLDLSDDMDQPLPHYFINSSHNTYLTGHQLTGKSSVEIYRQCLLAGCRCVELDFWNGRTEEPVIVHGYTLVPDISAKEVIEAIAEAAFKTSEYPVILSFENHCNPRQQAKIAQYCREIFGENLLDAPLESHKLEPGQLLPPPSLLKHKIIIKNKKKHHHHHHHHNQATSSTNSLSSLQQEGGGGEAVQGNGDIPHPPPLQARQSSKESAHEDDENEDEDESSSADEVEEDGPKEKASVDKVSAARETEAGAEISALVNYVQPVHFSSFENSEKKNRCYEMSSFDERQATTLLKERPIEFVNYNKHQLSRVYPAGTRFDSSNFMPQVFWNAGSQLVALNYQTLDLAMHLNLGMFEYNHRCGYLLKPEFMRRRDRRLDPFAESTVDGIIAGTVQVSVISGQFLTDKHVGTYVEVDMYGLPADTFRKKFRTKIVPANGINPTYGDEPFVFKKVVLPELASIRLTAYEESGRFIGHRVLPVVGLCPGYRHVSLRTESGQPLALATLFLLVVVKDYVPDGLSDFAEALANPIKYQSELEKRSQQLAVLTEDMDVIEEAPPGKLPVPEPQRPSPSRKPSIVPVSPDTENPTEPDSGVSSVVVAPEAPAQTEAPTSPPPVPGKTVLKANESLSSLPMYRSTEPESLSASERGLPYGRMQLIWYTSSAKYTVTTTTVTASEAYTVTSVTEDLVAEPLEKFMENKAVKEKWQELDKKLETLKKKHEKEKSKVQTQVRTSHHDNDGKIKSKFYGNMLVKRLSSKNMDLSMSTVQPDTPDCSECESEASKTTGLPRSQSERLLSLCKDYISHEKDLREKYHAMAFQTIEKLMKTSQANQLKLLHALLERETADVMRKLEAMRRAEVKVLAKRHKDRDELVRIKREVASSMVEKGVNERVRLTTIYEKKREELARQHEEVRHNLEEEKNKAMAELNQRYEDCVAKVEEDLQHQHQHTQSTAAGGVVTQASTDDIAQ